MNRPIHRLIIYFSQNHADKPVVVSPMFLIKLIMHCSKMLMRADIGQVLIYQEKKYLLK